MKKYPVIILPSPLRTEQKVRKALFAPDNYWNWVKWQRKQLYPIRLIFWFGLYFYNRYRFPEAKFTFIQYIGYAWQGV